MESTAGAQSTAHNNSTPQRTTQRDTKNNHDKRIKVPRRFFLPDFEAADFLFFEEPEFIIIAVDEAELIVACFRSSYFEMVFHT